MSSASPDSGLSSLIADLRQHFDQVVLPLWRGPGFNTAMDLPYEALSGSDALPLPPQRYRTMACARQLYVFAASPAADDLAHAGRLFDALLRHFTHPGRDGGWVYSVDAQGAPLDTAHDLYTYAFVVFACAAYYRRSGDARARDTLAGTVAAIEKYFTAPTGLYWSRLSDDYSEPQADVEQNPVMHLTEAYLAARAVGDEAWFSQALHRIADGVTRVFLHDPSRCVAELRLGTPDNRLEPGHQFEWFSLARLAPDIFADSVLGSALGHAREYAQRYGVDTGTEGVCAALDMAGALRDGTQRIWAQTEYARALAASGDARDLTRLQHQLARFRERFLHAYGWHECVDARGARVRADMPSTTPYHLATCYAALP